jgi:ankyrin repeat protein
MLSFATFEEAPASMSLTSLLRRNEATDTSSASYVVTFWFLLGFIYYGFATGGWYEGLSSLPCKLSISVEAMKDRCCPKRRARYLKCARRCNRRKGEAQDESPLDYECWFWQKFYPMHLPPPLPFKRHKTKYKSEDAKDSHAHLNDSTTTVVVNDSSGSVSSRGTVETTHSVALAHQQQVGEVSESSFLKRALPTKIATSTFKPAPPRAPLIDLARMQLWSAILQKVTRREAKYHDMDGLYPLHWACSGGPPIKVIHALLDYYPSAARKVDQEGSTPLHFACHYSASMGVMEALLQVYPKAIRMQDKYGRTPVYHAVHKSAGMEVLDLLLKADAATATTPCVPARAREQVAGDISRSLAVRTPLFLAWAAVLADRRTREEKRGKKWDKAILLLQAAYQHHSNVSPGVPRPFQSLLAALSLDLYLPESVVPVITEAHPEQLEHADPHTGQLPLALAAATSHYSASRSNALIELLLKGYPRAAQSRDRQGRFPLSLAVASGKRWDAGVEHLLRAAPDTLLWRDGQTGLVPAISAASAVVEKHEVGTVSEVSSTRLSTDPFGLLNTKQRESISRRSAEPAPSSIDAAVSTADPETRHVSTIYELVNAHPSVIVRATATKSNG